MILSELHDKGDNWLEQLDESRAAIDESAHGGLRALLADYDRCRSEVVRHTVIDSAQRVGDVYIVLREMVEVVDKMTDIAKSKFGEGFDSDTDTTGAWRLYSALADLCLSFIKEGERTGLILRGHFTFTNILDAA